jgi:hypothetical protein
MSKKWLLVCIPLLSIALLVTGCGVPKEDYDAVIAERDSAQAEIQSVKAELTASQANVSELTSSLDGATAELQAAKECMSSAKIKAEIVNALFIPAMTGELDQMSETEGMNYFLEWRDKIVSSKDPVLLEKFDALIASDFGDEQPFMDFFIYLLESIPETLE